MLIWERDGEARYARVEKRSGTCAVVGEIYSFFTTLSLARSIYLKL